MVVQHSESNSACACCHQSDTGNSKHRDTQRPHGITPLQCQVVQELLLCLSELAEKSGAHTHYGTNTKPDHREQEAHWQLSTLSLTAIGSTRHARCMSTMGALPSCVQIKQGCTEQEILCKGSSTSCSAVV